LTSAARSTVASSVVVNCVRIGASGRFAPAGGIIPARSLRIIFSVVSACSAALATS
jgi:hypothetical protein